MMNAHFDTIVGLVADGLGDSGFALSKAPVERWGARFALERANIDGTLVLSFGPMLKESETSILMPYLLVHEKSFYGEIRIPADSSPRAVANRFLTRIGSIIENSLLPEEYSDPHVGVGLIAPADADWTMKD